MNRDSRSGNQESPCVTSFMSDAITICDFQEMNKVIEKMNSANSTSAIAVDGLGKCVGILTRTDVQRYMEIWERFVDGDDTVLGTVYETDSFGLRRMNRQSFHRVRKHMTSPVITVADTTTVADAKKEFISNGKIHHLVVINQFARPIGIIEPEQLSV